MCNEIIQAAIEQQIKADIECPIRIKPKCHRKASINVFVDVSRKMITLSCSKCDQTITRIKIRNINAKMDKGTTP